jgi:hypothetical protein
MLPVHGPGEGLVVLGAELVAGREDDVGHARQGLDGRAVQQVGGDGLDAPGLQALAHLGVAEARDADHPLVRRGVLGQARERGAHLAGHAEDHEVAVDLREVVDEGLAGPREELLQRLDGLEALRQVGRVQQGDAAAPRGPGWLAWHGIAPFLELDGMSIGA